MTALIFDIPFGQGRRWGTDANPFLNAVLGGWSTTLIHTARSGYPIHVYYGPNSAYRACGGCRQRPNYVGGDVYGDRSDPNNYLNQNAFAVPTDVSQPFGNLGRNVARSSNFFQADLGVHKDFNLPGEDNRIEFRVELFNLLNKTNFLAPQPNVNSSSFGRITGTFPARQIQFALKLYF